ncbi:RHS repeat-associated core domain-containing protein [Actinoallomurus acaciae]
MTGRTDASGNTTYGYDTDGRLATAVDPITGRTDTYAYNNNSQLNTIAYGTGGPTRTFGWAQNGNLQSDTITNPAGQTIASTNYVYNPEHQIQTKTTTGYAGAGTTNYTYDWARRLKSQTAGATTTNYTFDASGNLTSDGTHTFTYDERDRLTTDGTATYSYTPRGTTASKTTAGQTTTYTNDAFDQLTNAGSTTYTYDALNRLIQRNSTDLAYSGVGNDLASDGSSTYSRDTNADLIGVADNGHNSAAITDQNHDDLIAALDPATSALNGSTSYDPYGNITATTGDQPAIGYQSGYTDPDTGQVNMHARWYNPIAGNFTSRDTIVNDPTSNSANANPYTYATGDPLDATDPTGHCSIFDWSWGCIARRGICELAAPACVFWDHIQGQLRNDDVCYPRCNNPSSGGGSSSSGLELMPRRGTTPKQRNTCWACLGFVGVGGLGGAGGAGAGAIGIVAPPPPPADPCAHNHHCFVPKLPKLEPHYQRDHEPTKPKDLPPGTPTIDGKPVIDPAPVDLPFADPTTGGGGGGIPIDNNDDDNCTPYKNIDTWVGGLPQGANARYCRPSDLNGGRKADPNVFPPGFPLPDEDGKSTNPRLGGNYKYDRCHLIAKQLGGDGYDPNNLFTCIHTINTPPMRVIENRVKAAVKARQRVDYHVSLVYRSGGGAMASAIHITATGTGPGGTPGLNIDACLENKVQGRVLSGSAC